MSVQSKIARSHSVYAISSDESEASGYRGSRSAVPLENLTAFARRDPDDHFHADSAPSYRISRRANSNLLHHLSEPAASDGHPRRSDIRSYISISSDDRTPPRDEVSGLQEQVHQLEKDHTQLE